MRPTACYFADLEFVVDSLGRPEVATARIVRSNYEAFGTAVLETLQGWRYEPAMRDGKTVRQIVTTHQTAASMIVVSKGPGPPPGGPPSQRAPTC
jgi:TonB family protein